MSAEREQVFWSEQAKRLMRRLNAAWWGEYFLPFLAVASVVLAAGVLVFRREQLSLLPLLVAYMLALCIAAVAIWVIVRKRFCSMQDALARLDKELKLYNQLSSAFQGVGAWPEPLNFTPQIEIQKRKLLAPLAISLLSVLASILVPIPEQATAVPAPAEQPLAWHQLEQALTQLEQSEVIEDEALEELRKQLQALQEQQRKTWFEQSSLEAGEALKENLASAIDKTASVLEALTKSLEQLGAESANSPNELKALEQQLKQQIESLQHGPLPPDASMVQELQQFSQAELDKANPDTIADLKQQLKQGQAVLGDAQDSLSGSSSGTEPETGQPGEQADPGERGDQQRGNEESNSQGSGQQAEPGGEGEPSNQGKPSQGSNSQGTGKQGGNQGQAANRGGSPSRGPGTAPLNLTPRDQLLETTELKRVTPHTRTSRNQPFTTSITKQAPQVDTDSPHSLQQNLPAAGGGTGGEAVWKYSTSPKEKEVLEKLFK